MRTIKTDWSAATQDELTEQLEELASWLIEKHSSRARERADNYLAAIHNSRYGRTMSIEGDDTSLSRLVVDVDSSGRKSRIDTMIISDKGLGLGSALAIDILSGLREMGIRKIELDAQDMGAAFWPKFGFAPSLGTQNERSQIAREYNGHFQVLKPYLSPLVSGMIGFELRKFDRLTPLKISGWKYQDEIAKILQDKKFTDEFRISANENGLDEYRKDIRYMVLATPEGEIPKLGALLSSRINMDMALNFSDAAQMQNLAKMEKRVSGRQEALPGKKPTPF